MKRVFAYALMLLITGFAIQSANAQSCSLSIDAGNNDEICIGESIVLTANVSGESTCGGDCTYPSDLLVKWLMDDCRNYDYAYDYSEFDPDYLVNGTCTEVSAGTLYRTHPQTNFHSCVNGVNGNGYGMCLSASSSHSAVFDNKSLKFDVTINPDNSGQLGSVKFYLSSPNDVVWNSSYYSQEYIGVNNYVEKYAIRVLSEGTEIFRQEDITTSRNWALQSFDFSGLAEFTVSQTTTFSFQLIGYDPVGNGSNYSVFEVDNIKVYGGCCDPSGTSNEVSYLWSNGETTQSITVSPSSTTMYTVTATDCENCEASDNVTVIVGVEGNLNAGADQAICDEGPIQLSASGANYGYLWTTDGDGTFSNTLISNPVYTLGPQDIVNGTFVLAVSDNRRLIPDVSTADYYTTSAGNWNNSNIWNTGSVPSGDISGKTIILKHDVTVTDRNIVLSSGSNFYSDGIAFTMYPNYNYTVKDGNAVFVDGSFLQLNNINNTPFGNDGDGVLEITHQNGSLTMIGMDVWVAQNFINSYGERYLRDVCLIVDENYQNKNTGIDTLINVCIEVAYEEYFNGSGSGNFQNYNMMYVSNSQVHTYNGNIQNQSAATMTGHWNAIWDENGNLQNIGTWTATIDHYCVDQLVEGFGGISLPSENCNDIEDYFCNCDGGLCGVISDYLVVTLVDFNIEATVTPSSICPNDLANLTVNPIGGEAPYTFVWSQGLGTGQNKTVTPSTTTTYEVTSTDANGCHAIDEVTVLVSDDCNPPIDEWFYECEEGKRVDEYGYNSKCNKTVTFIIPDFTSVFQYVVEIVYKGSNPGTTIFVTDEEGNNHTLERTQPIGGSSNVWVYRGLVSGTTESVTYADNVYDCSMQSVVLYVFRDDMDAGASSGKFTTLSGYNDIQTASINIPTDTEPRDLAVMLPISELTTDGRYILITVEAGGVSEQQFLYGPDASLSGGSCCLAIPAFTLTDVPGSATQVNITLDSRNGQNGQSVNGQSWTVAGSVSVDVECPECVPPTGGSIANDETNCGGFDPEEIVSLSDPVGFGCDFIPPNNNGPDCCDAGDKPIQFVLLYNGESCGDSDNNQGNIGSKWDCDGDALGDTEVYIEVEGDHFSGIVSLNGTFTVFNDGDRLNNPIKIHIYDEEGGTEIQYIEIHASCSSPIVTSDQFGSIILLSSIFENGEECGDATGLSYQWEQKEGNNEWVEIVGANDLNYDPSFITFTTCYRRKSFNCCGEAYSNIVCKSIAVPDPGEIGSDEFNCGGFDPQEITSIEDAQGGCPVISDNDCCEEHGDHNHASGLALRYVGSSSPISIQITSNHEGDQTSYSASHQTNDLIIIEANDRLGTNTNFSVGNNSFSFHTSCSSGGLDAGQGIDIDGDLIDNPNPNASDILFIIEGVSTPDGCTEGTFTGSDPDDSDLTYQWQFLSETSGTWVDISGATNETYDPSFISETTQYRRLVTNCCGTSESNIVIKEVGLEVTANFTAPDPQCVGGTYTFVADSCFANGVSTTLVTINKQVSSSMDDIEERASDGFIYTSSSDLELTDDTDYIGPQVIGIRFTGLNIPQGATIVSSTITFTADEADGSNSEPANLIFKAHDVDNAPAFTTATSNVSSRNTTSNAANWSSVPEWFEGSMYTTPNLTSVIQEVINRGGWSQGNSLAFIITGSGERTAVAYNSVPSSAPKLEIVYSLEETVAVDCSYDWTFPDGTPSSATTQTASVTWSTGGTKTIQLIVTAQDGCADTVIQEIEVGEINVNVDDAEVCIGNSVVLTASGADSYLWSTGETTASITVSPTSTTTYTVTGTDANGCTGNDDAIVTILPNPIANAGDDQSTCGVEQVTLEATATEGVGPYTFEWNQGLGAGPVKNVMPEVTTTYTVLVTDANGCEDTDEVTVVVNPNPTVDIDGGRICAGESITITAQYFGGQEPYTFEWLGGFGTNPSITVAPTSTTVYTITITDANGCIDTDAATVFVNPNPSVTIDLLNTNGEICLGQEITMTASADGGSNPYTFAWNNGLGSGAVQTVSPTQTTTYTVTVTDNEGCNDEAEVTIIVLPNPTVVIDDQEICRGAEATITAQSSGGTPTYTYEWSDGLGTGESVTVSPMLTTTYTVTITDSEGCTSTDDAIVVVNSLPNVFIELEGNGMEFCEGQSVTMIASVLDGAAPYSFTWNEGLGNGPVKTVTPTQTTTYVVTVVDANGCSDNSAITIIVNPKPTVVIGDAAICSGFETTITAQGSGGTPPYSYEWSDGLGTGETVTVSPTNTTTYSVTITDDKGCTATDDATITVNPDPIANAGDDQSTCGVEESTLLASATGGTPDYTYEWNQGLGVGAEQTVMPEVTTTYTVLVTDANGCTDTDEVTVTVNNLSAFASNDETICEGEIATLSVIASQGSGTYIYSWNNGAGNTSTVSVSPHLTTVYTVTVTDAITSCVAIDSVTITVEPPIVSGIDGPTSSCAGEEVTFNASPLVIGATYSWSFNGPATPLNASGPTATVVWNGQGVYTATLVVTKGACFETYTHDINITLGVFADAGPDKIVCEGQSVQIGGNPTGPSAANYLWTPNQYINNNTVSNPMVTPPVTTTYIVQVSLNGCLDFDTVTVVVDPSLNPNPDAGPDKEICKGESVTIGGAPDPVAFFYQWSTDAGNIPGANSSFLTVSPIVDTWYYVDAFSQAGCIGRDSVFVKVNLPPLPPMGMPEVIACDDKPLPTLIVTVEEGITADWYDAPSGGNLLAEGTLSYQPLVIGVYYVFARNPQTGCVSEESWVIDVSVIDCDNCPTPDCSTITIMRN